MTDTFLLYRKLVDLLLGNSKDEKIIKELMQGLGIEYKDTANQIRKETKASQSIDRLSAVLAFDPRTPIKGKTNDLQ